MIVNQLDGVQPRAKSENEWIDKNRFLGGCYLNLNPEPDPPCQYRTHRKKTNLNERQAHKTKHKGRKIGEQEDWRSEIEEQPWKFHEGIEEDFVEGYGYRPRNKWRMDNLPATAGVKGLLLVNFGQVLLKVSTVGVQIPANYAEWQ